MKKRILIVDNNLKLGGIQKALVSLLKQIHDKYDITLMLLYKVGTLLSEVPQDVRVIETKSDFRFMGMAQADCIGMIENLHRGAYALICKYLTRRVAVKLISLTLSRDTQEIYDVAISFSHIGDEHALYGGTAEYILQAVKAQKKICYIHCDYPNSGNRSVYSDKCYSKFDAIVCVSESTQKHFLETLPFMTEHTYSAINPIDEEEIELNATRNAIDYNKSCINLLSVARLTPEKGIARFVNILGKMNTERVRYTIVGDGIERTKIEQLIKLHHLENVVTMCGEDDNPYRYMVNADLMVVPSYHEAAPVIFQEAQILHLPIFTTRTTSADEMVGEQFGFVVDNNDDAIQAGLQKIFDNTEVLKSKRLAGLKNRCGQSDPEIIEIIAKILTKQ